jgi:hypothetical protein
VCQDRPIQEHSLQAALMSYFACEVL